jgi:hypothetical protein
MLTPLLKILYLHLQPLDFLIIFAKLLLIRKFPITQPVKSRLLRLVQVVIEHNNRFILSYREAHIAYTVLFRVIHRELLLVLRAFLTYIGPASIAMVGFTLEGTELAFAVLAVILLHLRSLFYFKGVWQGIGDQVLN